MAHSTHTHTYTHTHTHTHHNIYKISHNTYTHDKDTHDIQILHTCHDSNTCSPYSPATTPQSTDGQPPLSESNIQGLVQQAVAAHII